MVGSSLHRESSRMDPQAPSQNCQAYLQAPAKRSRQAGQMDKNEVPEKPTDNRLESTHRSRDQTYTMRNSRSSGVRQGIWCKFWEEAYEKSARERACVLDVRSPPEIYMFIYTFVVGLQHTGMENVHTTVFARITVLDACITNDAPRVRSKTLARYFSEPLRKWSLSPSMIPCG